MKFRFPIVIIDEDYRAENTSGLGIRALAKAIEDGCHLNNPRPCTVADLRYLYEKSW
mgnify:CR=1 FL=1